MPMAVSSQHESKTRLIEAALSVIRTKGYSASTVEDICESAGLTKGSFFHHFRSKDDLALDAIRYWNTVNEKFFADAPFQQQKDPLQRLFGYLNLRASILTDEIPEFTCLLGTLLQETHETHPEIRAACERGLATHVDELTRDLKAAKKRYAPKATWSAEEVGYFIQGALQGSFIFAKAKQNSEAVRQTITHLRRYLEFLFNRETAQ